jgi:hypothetical protein
LFENKEVTCFEFGVSPIISVYLYSVIAGPYATVESEIKEV